MQKSPIALILTALGMIPPYIWLLKLRLHLSGDVGTWKQMSLYETETIMPSSEQSKFVISLVCPRRVYQQKASHLKKCYYIYKIICVGVKYKDALAVCNNKELVQIVSKKCSQTIIFDKLHLINPFRYI